MKHIMKACALASSLLLATSAWAQESGDSVYGFGGGETTTETTTETETQTTEMETEGGELTIKQTTTTESESTTAADGGDAFGGAATVNNGPRDARNQGWAGSTWGLSFRASGAFAAFATPAYGGSIAGHYFLSDKAQLRLGFNLARATAPSVPTETVTDNGIGEPVPTFTQGGSGADNINFGVGADFITRLTKSEVAPYVGGGLSFGLTSNNNFIENSTVRDVRTVTNNQTMIYNLALRGILGAEWRIHKSISVFLEYQLGLTLLNYTDVNNETVVEVSSDAGTSTSRTTVRTQTPRTFNITSGIAHSGGLGVQFHF